MKKHLIIRHAWHEWLNVLIWQTKDISNIGKYLLISILFQLYFLSQNIFLIFKLINCTLVLLHLLYRKRSFGVDYRYMDFSHNVLLKHVWIIYMFYIYFYTSSISFDTSHIKDYGRHQRIFVRIGQIATNVFNLYIPVTCYSSLGKIIDYEILCITQSFIR